MSYDLFISDFVDRREPHTDTATDAAEALMQMYLADEPFAVSKVRDLVRSGLLTDIKGRRAAPHKATYTDSRGRKRTVNTAVSRKVHDERTGDVVAYQLVLEWDMTSEQLNALLAELQSAAGELRGRIAVVRALLSALERHPECETARCAWLADGRPLDQIDLSSTA